MNDYIEYKIIEQREMDKFSANSLQLNYQLTVKNGYDVNVLQNINLVSVRN